MSQSSKAPVIRAIDVGYGHVKYVLRHDFETGKIDCDGFPSRSPRSQGTDLSSGVMSKMDTVTVEVGGRMFEVGKQVISAAGANDASEILSRDFALTDAYMARLYGALSYMLPHIPGGKIDWLILGLPKLTLNEMSKPLEERVLGNHVVNTSGATVEIERVRVFPQPLGAFFDYGFRQKNVEDLKKRVNLIVDPGYNTFDWLVTEGLAPSGARSGSVELGMSAVVRAIAEEVLQVNKLEADANLSRVVNRLDNALCNNESFRVFGREIDLKSHLAAGDFVIDQAISALEKNVGKGDDIDNIFLAGGGAPLFHKALQAKYPNHKVVQLTSPQYANVRGFQYVGSTWAHSAMRAGGGNA
jgi:plasmid segregation protein ParM